MRVRVRVSLRDRVRVHHLGRGYGLRVWLWAVVLVVFWTFGSMSGRRSRRDHPLPLHFLVSRQKGHASEVGTKSYVVVEADGTMVLVVLVVVVVVVVVVVRGAARCARGRGRGRRGEGERVWRTRDWLAAARVDAREFDMKS